MYYLSDNLWALKRSEECLGENPKGFPTQRVALEEEGQLRFPAVRSSGDASS